MSYSEKEKREKVNKSVVIVIAQKICMNMHLTDTDLETFDAFFSNTVLGIRKE